VLARSALLTGLAGLVTLCLAACRDTPAPSRPAEGPPSSPVAAAETGLRPRIVFLGDSLTAGLGLDSSASFPSLIAERLDERHLDFEVVNAGVSGDTSAGGLRRLDWALDGEPRVLVLALGANDGLRGLPTTELGKNLAAIIEASQARGVSVILAGMEAPPNNGKEYASRFRAVYPDLATSYDIPLIPFLLQGVAGDPALNQADGIHPNADGARRVADIVWQALEPVLAEDIRKSR
jgi:acyl-CoA thioesterase-1